MRSASRSPRQLGLASVEFACILPMFLSILFGIVEMSVALYDKAVIANAAREGARAGIVYKTPRVTSAQITNVVSTYTDGLLISFKNPTVPTVVVDQSAGTTPGNPLKVTVTYVFTGLLLGPLVEKLSGPVTVKASAVMAYE